MAQPSSDDSSDEIRRLEDDTEDRRRLPGLADDAEETRPLVSRQRIIPDISGYVPHGERLQALRNELARCGNWYCTVTILVLLLCVAVALRFGVYASEALQLGPNSSILLKANSFFVDSIKVVELDEAEGSMLYGFNKNPPLDVLVSWSEIYKTSLPISTHKEWMYYLNEGSQMNISYSLNSSSLSSLILVIAQGKKEFANWLEDRSYSSANLSWKIIQGNGTIQKAVLESSGYYVAVRNVNTESVEVQLTIIIKAFIFNTTEPYYKCILAQGQCNFKLSFLGGNVAVLTRPGQQLGISGGGSNVEISYQPRWITYLVGVGGMAALVLVIHYFLNHIQLAEQETGGDQAGGLESETRSLPLDRDDDAQAEGGGNVQDLCAICLDAPTDCVFFPCRHGVACLGCAEKTAVKFGKCPVCRGPINKEYIMSLSS